MKICIPIEYRREGGLYTFVANFTRYLTAHGVPFTQSPADDYDVLFVNSWVVPPATVRRLKRGRRWLRVVQRVDGAAQDHGRPAETDTAQADVNVLADVTVFQSQYARFSTREKFRVVPHDGPVIYNPVDVRLFSPAGPRPPRGHGRPRLASVSWSTNRKKGTWRIDRLAADNPDLEFVLCGRFEDVPARENVRLMGHLDRDELAATLRSCDLLLDLSEHEACPNVVLEALASGLPILHNDSGGVPELVGDAGVPMVQQSFREPLEALLARRDELGVKARARAEALFSPDVIFPQYLSVIASAERHPPPQRSDLFALADQGYPVSTRAPMRATALVGTVARRTARAVDSLVGWIEPRRVRGGNDMRCRVGWITFDSFDPPKRRFSQLTSFTRLRAGNVGEWVNRHQPDVHNELYHRGRHYDVVVFQKMMDARSQDEARRIQAGGGRVIFDANVNYYDIWGDYFIPGTRPTDQQQQDAIAMTQLADWVVADSSAVAAAASRFNPRVTWIPDPVDLDVYRGVKVHAARRPVTLIWSGVGKKAAHLLEARDALAAVVGIELLLVSDTAPDCLAELRAVVPCRVLRFSDRRYAQALLDADVIISPKRLCNAYEMGHTEYKIALGMAVGLPAIASPQQSYVEAIGYAGGGVIADTSEQWTAALEALAGDATRRQAVGANARRPVLERYSTAGVARQYMSVLLALARREAERPSIPAVQS
jgi:glycosyltransferase involved in cell wall biosynthesis